MQNYDVIVVGAGHAGVESALALGRTGFRTLLLAINLDSTAYLACNPSIGGTAKGHLVREIDALGGQMAINADKTLLQLKILNESKGVAVQALRGQVDKHAYHATMKQTLEHEPNIFLKQAEAREILCDNGAVKGVATTRGDFFAPKVIVCCGVYLNAKIITGEFVRECGPNGFERATALSASLAKLGHEIRRFKTGTPARIDGKTVNYSALEPQYGNQHAMPFSHLTAKEDIDARGIPCYLGYTTAATRQIITQNINRAPLYSGIITGTGARYCPSIEDKMMRFADKERHQFFLEPEGRDTAEMYLQGISTSMPTDIQLQIVRSLQGMECAEIMRDAYAIEYDCIDPKSLQPSLESKHINGLYFAGQINGTSGYEEAAAQGLVAGINASLALRGKPALILGRHQGYIGVLIDDLVTKGTNEPYRMMTSRAEYRLCLRQDNADTRLTQIGRDIGIVDDCRYDIYTQKQEDIKKITALLETKIPPQSLVELFVENGENPPVTTFSVAEVFRYGKISAESVLRHLPIFKGVRMDALAEVFTEVRYQGYLARQKAAIKNALRMEEKQLPNSIDYSYIKGLRLEAQQKLNALKPLTLGQASRISGVTPADINVLITYLNLMRD